MVIIKENNNYATIFNFPPTYDLKFKLICAIHPFFCKDMVELPMNGVTNSELGFGFVRIKFLIPKATGEGRDLVDAMRISPKLNRIFYYFNEEQYIDPIQIFQERCQINVSSFYPFLNQIFSNENANLLHNWLSSKCPLRAATEKSFEFLADYLELFNSNPQSKKIRIGELAETNLLIDRECGLLKKHTFVVVANEIGRIFNYITFEEYSVKFFIPLSGKILNMQEVKWEDMDLSKVETRVTKTSWQNSCVWNQLEPGLKNLLKISQTIALAKHLKQHFIFIEDTTWLQEYQNKKMINEAIIEIDKMVTDANWRTKSHIKQIVDICHEMEIMIFLSYHGELALVPTNANIIKCRDPQDTNGQSIYVHTNSQPMRLDGFDELFIPSNTLSSLV